MAGKEIRSSFLDREIRMVLVGKTGVGKSETGNTICGGEKMDKVFESLAGPVSVTKKCKQHCFTRFGYDLQLVDVPGFCDTSRSDDDIQKEVMKCVMMSSPGIHAILFIVRIGRFTEEDKSTLEKFLQCFGKEAKRFVIVVFTGEDDLQAGGNTLKNYIGECPVKLKTFLFDTSHRFISVNNRGTDNEKETFTKDLIETVKHMVDNNGGQCYTNEMYDRCKTDLQDAEKNEKLEGKWRAEFAQKVEQEIAAFEEQLQKLRIKMQELEKQIEKGGKSKEKDKKGQLKERERAEKRRVKEERAEEKRRQAEQKEAEQNVIKNLRKQIKEEYMRKKEELERELARKQIREKVEEDHTNYFERSWQRFKSFFQK